MRIRSLVTSGGSRIDLPDSGVVAFVGGNNVGKSQLLRDLWALLSSWVGGDTDPLTLSAVEILKPRVDAEAAQRWMEENASETPMSPGQARHFQAFNGSNALSAANLAMYLGGNGPQLGQAAPFFAWYATAGALSSVAVSGIGMPGMSPTANPLSRLIRDGALEESLSQLADDTFAMPLTLDRVNGDTRLRVGSVDVAVPPLNRPTLEYADAVAALPRLEDQGDGIKSFTGLALQVIAGSAQILIVDEPEAFLHPGQARALGRWLARQAVDHDKQILLATHDRDLLLGLLDGGPSSRVHLARISRTGRTTHLDQLPSEGVGELWGDPVLRYSNVLQGLFHRHVVVCEADADCRFYGAAVDALSYETDRRAAADETLFVPSGGKQRVPMLARSLVALGVKVTGILDFDVLRSKADIKAVVESLGARWTEEMNQMYVSLSSALNESQLWDKVKNTGLEGVPAGAPYSACRDLLENLREVGAFVVPVGEMEDYDKSFNKHGAAWVSEMLERGIHKTASGPREIADYILKGSQ